MATRGFEHVTQADVNRRALKQALRAKPPKYHNVKVVVDGHRFDSKREADYWCLLRVREKAGEIFGLQRQVSFPLYAPVLDEGGGFSVGIGERCHVVASYVADFVYRDTEDHHLHVLDAKGKRLPLYTLKAKWLFLQQGITIEEV